MTPEEKFNQDVWWILQEIKKEELLASKGEKIEFSIRSLPKPRSIKREDVDYGFPSEETQQKLLYKLKGWKAIDNLEPTVFDFNNFFSPPRAYSLTIRQPKFNNLYYKYKEKNAQDKFQDLPKNKGVINEEWTEQEILEIVLLELNKIASRHIQKNTCNVEITIAPLDKSIVDPKETALRKKAISFLKSQGIIQDYKLGKSNENIIFFNYLKNKNPEGEHIKMGVLIANCKVNPQKVIDYAVKVFEPKKSYCEKLAELYAKLIDIVEIYFARPIIRDRKLNNFYAVLTENIKEMINEDLIPQFKLKDWQPFTNLFSAEEEMKRKGVNLKETIQKTNAFLGEIYKFITIFDVKPKKEKEKIRDLDNYLALIGSQKRKQNKESATSKMEIVGWQDGLKVITQANKKDKNKFPYKLPLGTKWENFTIKFEDNENVFIQVKQFKHNADYKKMGMVGRGKSPNPSEVWIFMKVLAQVNGELTIKDSQARDKYKKQKELLARALQNYFSLDYDPFYPYHSSIEKSGNSYKIKITLIPPPNKKEKADTNKDNNDDLGIEEEYKKQTPEIYDKYQ